MSIAQVDLHLALVRVRLGSPRGLGLLGRDRAPRAMDGRVRCGGSPPLPALLHVTDALGAQRRVLDLCFCVAREFGRRILSSRRLPR